MTELYTNCHAKNERVHTSAEIVLEDPLTQRSGYNNRWDD